MEKFCGPAWGPKRAKPAKKWIFPGLGAVLGETPTNQICLHAECGPSEPCLGSHVSLGPGIWPFWGALGAISSVEDRFCLLGSQPTKTSFWPDLGATGEVSGNFWLIGTRCATFVRPRLLMVRPPAVKIRDLLILGGLEDLKKFCGPVWGPKRGKSVQKWIIPLLGAILGSIPPDQSCLHAMDPVNPVWGPMCPWGPGYGRFGGRWGPFRQLGTGSVC